jgi:hypothetical protein
MTKVFVNALDGLNHRGSNKQRKIVKAQIHKLVKSGALKGHVYAHDCIEIEEQDMGVIERLFAEAKK